ncbi:MAG: hypothetical protein M0Q23_07805 [Syntrophales bacterium]|jgi:hypothetical protein|nr:hypothetical protein [Syntrophales bacterium]MCK9528528.1 hypothetical protein [Syntrophales bacterium]MDX9922845.1 poly(R)-hydroxyalkanoic acid synthase subunit PhaE [Syntrophales bacterium]
MDDRRQDSSDGPALAEAWLKTGSDMMSTFIKMVSAVPSSGLESGKKGRSVESWEAAMKTWQSLQALMSEPETANAVLKGTAMMPDILMKIAETTWDACFEMQKKAIERAGTIGQRVEAYQLESVDQDFFKALKDIYEEELRQFLQVPQLGLTRFYQERANQFLDKVNLMNMVAIEFLSLLFLPFEQSFKVMQQRLDELAGDGKLPEETREYYTMFIRILEGHFMTLLKSPEYTRTLETLLSNLSEYIISRNEVLQDMLQSMPIPTYREMDELYKELYLMKKKVRELESRLEKGSR